MSKRGNGGGTPGTALDAPGRDVPPERPIAFSRLDLEFDDFDEQSEQLSGHGQEYVKLSAGGFRGRFVSAFLDGGVSVHYETVNCAMHQRVGCPEGLIGFGVSTGPAPVAANGVELDRRDVIITRPGAELELYVPPEGAEFLMLSVDLRTLESLVRADSGSEHLDPDSRGTSVVRSPFMAGTLQSGGMAMLQTSARAPGTWRPHGAAGALVAGTVAALDLDTGLGAARERTPDGRSAAVLAAARDALSAMEEFDYAALAAATGKSPRTIQMAFAELLGTTPIGYFRAVRLHRARKALLTGAAGLEGNIGDIAAAHGFWSWSRFTQHYRRQYGETPSQTRARAGGAYNGA